MFKVFLYSGKQILLKVIEENGGKEKEEKMEGSKYLDLSLRNA